MGEEPSFDPAPKGIDCLDQKPVTAERQYTLNVLPRGKQLVLFSRES